jgi:serine phosphatase RsbU (regulator of sigma subunit)
MPNTSFKKFHNLITQMEKAAGSELQLDENIDDVTSALLEHDKLVEQQKKLYRELDKLKKVIIDLDNENSKYALVNWREKEIQKKLTSVDDYKNELEKKDKQIEQLKMIMAELEATNNNLVLATFRERDTQKKLKQATEELDKSKNSIIESQSKRIADSINYARKIQASINPSEVDIQKVLPDSFMYYKPKDVVSGDFPWFYQKGNYVYVAAVDCTGHGVPGAMMSIIGNLLLVDLVDRALEYEPGELLDMLHKRVVRTLKQSDPNNNSSDGMDVAVCRINTETKELKYSGAHRSLVLYSKSNNTVAEIKGDKFPIGGLHYEKKRTPFVTHSLQLQNGDAFYIYSDGFTDQPGGSEEKKYTSKRFIELLNTMKGEKVTDIGNKVKENFEAWMEGHKQLDDILLIGIGI